MDYRQIENMTKTIIVIPCYNEGSRLDIHAFVDFIRLHKQNILLFINDGSKDNTLTLLNLIKKEMPEQTDILDIPQNVGKAEAVRQGIQKALTFSPEFIGYLDADLAAPLESMTELEYLITKNRKNIAIGSRVLLMGRRIERHGPRHIVGRLFATMASLILQLRIYDTQCGAKLFRVTKQFKQVFAIPFTVRWIFDVEILARFIILYQNTSQQVKDMTIEHPLQEWVDKKGSKLRLIDFLISGIDLIKISILLQRKNLPTR